MEEDKKFEEFFKWITEKVPVGNILDNPVELAVSEFSEKSIEFLKKLEEMGKLLTIKDESSKDGKIRSILLKSASLQDQKTEEISEEPKEADTVILEDTDNLIITACNSRGYDVFENFNSVHYAIESHAKSLGKISFMESYITFNTARKRQLSEKLENFIAVKKDYDVFTVIVPPTPNAADKKIEERVNFILSSCPKIKKIVLIGRDAKAFVPLCLKIRESGREDHVITPGSLVGGLSKLSNRVISLFKLIDLLSKPKNFPRNPFSVDPLYFSMIYLKDKMKDGVDKEELSVKEEFLLDVLNVVKKETERINLSRRLLLERVTENIGRKWLERGFGQNQLRSALNVLTEGRLILKTEIPQDNGNAFTSVYFYNPDNRITPPVS